MFIPLRKCSSRRGGHIGHKRVWLPIYLSIFSTKIQEEQELMADCEQNLNSSSVTPQCLGASFINDVCELRDYYMIGLTDNSTDELDMKKIFGEFS